MLNIIDINWLLVSRSWETRAKIKVIELDFRRPEIAGCRHMIGPVPWDKTLEGRRAKESWYLRITLSKLKNCPSQWTGNEWKMPRGPHWSTRTSWQNANAKRKHGESGSKGRQSGRNIETQHGHVWLGNPSTTPRAKSGRWFKRQNGFLQVHEWLKED